MLYTCALFAGKKKRKVERVKKTKIFFFHYTCVHTMLDYRRYMYVCVYIHTTCVPHTVHTCTTVLMYQGSATAGLLRAYFLPNQDFDKLSLRN